MLTTPPAQYGVWIDGAGWDRKKACLVDQAPKVLFYELPVVNILGQLENEKRFGWGFGSGGQKIDTSLYSVRRHDPALYRHGVL